MLPHQMFERLAKLHAQKHYNYIDIEQPLTAEQAERLRVKKIGENLYWCEKIGFMQKNKNNKLEKIKKIEK